MFEIHVTRREDGGQSCEIRFPGHFVTIDPDPDYDPLRDLLPATIALFEGTRGNNGDNPRYLSFTWYREPRQFFWMFFSHPESMQFRLLVVTFETPGSRPVMLVDAVLDARDFAGQLHRDARAMMRDNGIVKHGDASGWRSGFPLGDFFRLHHIVTGEPVPATLKEEAALLGRLAGESG